MKLTEAVTILQRAGIENARNEALWLFLSYSGQAEATIHLRDPDVEAPALSDALRRRMKGEPLAYILGEWDFYTETYFVSPDCLIPRPETEMLVEYAVAHLPPYGRFADLCTGSGCIGISTLKARPDCTAALLELSPEALAMARRNMLRHGVEERAQLIAADLLSYTPEATYDMILSNPPYVKDNVYNTLQKEIFHEPRMAFVGGEDGLVFYRAIFARWLPCLSPGGHLVLEIGYDQEESILEIGAEHGLRGHVQKDLSGHPRMAVFTKPGVLLRPH